MDMEILPTGQLSDEGKPCIYEGRDEHGFLCAQLKWDGCLNVWMKGSVEEGKEAWTEEGKQEGDCDYVHLCSPIETLEKLLTFAKAARAKMIEHKQWCGES